GPGRCPGGAADHRRRPHRRAGHGVRRPAPPARRAAPPASLPPRAGTVRQARHPARPRAAVHPAAAGRGPRQRGAEGVSHVP
ncbi:MAG: hypothetical protein EOO33_18990, partial [Comamonadaceae bacterium]